MLTKSKYLQKNLGQLDRISPFGDVTYTIVCHIGL